MNDRIAFDAIIWLIHASGEIRDLNVALIGGEPLLRFDLIKRLVPFAKRRASYHGKTIHFSATTNNTLVTDEIIDFWRRWGMGFHCSIDGIPVIQNKNRPLAGGKPSSKLVEEGVKKILSYRPNVCARCTIVPDNVEHIEDNYLYFRKLGFINIAMVPGNPWEWDQDSLDKLADGFRKVAEHYKKEIYSGNAITVKNLSDHIETIARKKERTTVMCGAGRGMVLIDVNGDIWPCHRWNKEAHHQWKIGSIYKSFSEDARKKLDVRNQIVSLVPSCHHCVAQNFCSGGCPAENLEASGDAFQPIENTCRISRILAEIAKESHDTMFREQNDQFMKIFYPKTENASDKDKGL